MGTKNTDLVANFEASPQVANNSAELHGVLRTAHGTVELAAGDSDNDDIVMLAPIPSNAAVPSLFLNLDLHHKIQSIYQLTDQHFLEIQKVYLLKKQLLHHQFYLSNFYAQKLN
jgi:hypothetical protein